MDDVEGVRDSLLRVAWADVLATNAETVRSFPAAARAIDVGASSEDVVALRDAASVGVPAVEVRKLASRGALTRLGQGDVDAATDKLVSDAAHVLSLSAGSPDPERPLASEQVSS